MATNKKRAGAELARARALHDHERVIESARKSFVDMGRSLGKIRNERLYGEEFGTFAEYCEARWEISEAYANRVINAARVALQATPIGVEINSEAVARELVVLTDKPELLRQVWDEAERRACGGRITAALVAEARDSLIPTDAEPALEGEIVDPLAAIPAAKEAIAAFLADQSTPADRDLEASLETPAVATTGQPEVDRPGPVDLGDEDGAATPSDAQPSVPSVLASGIGEATGTGVASLHSEPVERQQGRAGVSAPAAAPGKTFDEVLDEFVPDGDPHRLWRSTWLKAIKNAWGPASFAVADIAANGDDNTFAALIDIRDFYDELLTKVQAERIRIAEAADADLPDNVRPIRRTA